MAYNQSDQFFEQSTDTNGNFGNSVSRQTNSFFLPKVYSKQVLTSLEVFSSGSYYEH